MNETPAVDLEQLVRDGAWLRRFVGTLVAPQDVDDVVQASWLAAVQGGERSRGGIGGWVRGVAANVARMVHRSQLRRDRALRRLPPRDDEAAACDVAAGLEVQRAVSDALLALPEPTRTIVVLRYQEGLSPAAIATRVGLRADAVRQRLHRGRDAVRERLQQRFGTDWRGSAPVLAFVRGTRGAAPAVAASAIAVLALAGAVLATSMLIASQPGGAPAIGVAATAAVPATAANDARSAPPAMAHEPERVLVAKPAQDPVPPAPATAPTKIEVRGRLIAAENRAPIAGATIARDRDEPILSGPDGRFVVAYDAKAKRRMIWFRAAGRCDRWCEHQPRSIDLGDIAMTRGHEVRGRVVDEQGASITKLPIETRVEGEVPDGSLTFRSTTNATGAFVFEQLLPEGRCKLEPEGGCGFVFVDGEVTVAASAPNDFVLRARRLRSISGVVFDSDGRPCANVHLAIHTVGDRDPNMFTHEATHSAPDGSFEIFDRRDGTDAAAFVDVSDDAAHDLVGDRVRCEWGASGVRVIVRPRIPVRLLVVEAESGSPITDFNAFSRVLRGPVCSETGSGNQPSEWPGGRYTFAGLPAGAHVVVFATDPERAPVVLAVDEAMRVQDDVRMPLPKLEPFALELVDARGDPIVAEFDVIDRRGIAAPAGWCDFLGRTGYTESFMPVVPFRVSSGKTDKKGEGTLRAPTDRRDLALRFTRDTRNVWVPIKLSAAGKPLRVVAPN